MVFVLFFASIMVIQFIAMFFHRFGTLSQILASTDIKACTKRVCLIFRLSLGVFKSTITLDFTQLEDISEQAFLEKNAVQIAREIQQFVPVDEEVIQDENGMRDRVGRRNTIHNLSRYRQSRNQAHSDTTLEANFRRRIDSIAHDPNLSSNSFFKKLYIIHFLIFKNVFYFQDPLNRRMSKGTILAGRRSTLIQDIHRRSSIAIQNYEANKQRRSTSTLGGDQ